MKRIGLTQRVEITDYLERRDCLDQQWSRLVTYLQHIPIPLSNINNTEKVRIYLDALKLDGAIMTGGNDLSWLPDAKNTAGERDHFEKCLLDHCIEKGIPVLGVCRGMQFIATVFDAQISRIDGHVRTKHYIQPYTHCFGSKELFMVNSFHNYAVTKVGFPLHVLARAEDGTIEAFEHASLPIVGIMWHPERENPLKKRDFLLLKSLFGVLNESNYFGGWSGNST